MGFPDRESERPTAISHDDGQIRISEEDTVTLHGSKSTSSGGWNQLLINGNRCQNG
jgi:hypothetical protein